MTAAGDRVRARAGRPARHGPGRGGGERASRGGRHPARAGRGPRPDGPHGRHRRVPRRGGAPDRDRGRRRGGRGRAADLPPRQGPRVGRGLPAGARGGHAADPPGDRARRARPRSGACCTSGSPGRGATCGCRGRPGGRAPRVAKAGAAARGSSTGSFRPARPRVDGADARAAGSRPADGRTPKVDPADRSPLSNALRAWRTARARADAVAPFIVFHDSTIEAIAARRPRSMAELRRVPGVGPTKLDRYGEEIIGVVVREG